MRRRRAGHRRDGERVGVVFAGLVESVRRPDLTTSTTPRDGEQERRRRDVARQRARFTSRRPPTPRGFSRAASAAAAPRQSSSPSRNAYITERDAATSALAGPLVNARAMSAATRTLRTDAGQEQDRLRQELPRLGDRARIRGTDDRADAREAAVADQILAELVHELRDLLPDRTAVGERQILDVARRRRSTS